MSYEHLILGCDARQAGKQTILVLQKGHISFFLFINFADSIIQYIPSGVVVSRRHGFNDFFLSLANFLLFFLREYSTLFAYTSSLSFLAFLDYGF